MASRLSDDGLAPIPDETVGRQRKSTSSKKTTYVVLCILFVELCERLTFYGLSANLVFYCRDVLKLSSPSASTIALAFQGTCYFTPVIGGWLADSVTGRYNVVYGSSLLYIVGTALLTATTYDYPAAYALSIPSKGAFLTVSLILIAIATGGIKANVSPLGADQVKDEGQEMVQKFFDWFYWFIQVGSLIAFTAVVYVQQELSFFYGYLITALSIILATLLLLIGRSHYIVHPPKGSFLTDTLRIIGVGIKNKLRCKKYHIQTHWLDGAKDVMGGNFSEEMVEAVKSLIRLVPIFLTFIFYWTVFGQGLTTYLLQGSYMKLEITDKFTFPAASLSVFENAALLVLIPFIDRVVYPGLRRFGFNFTPLRRIGVGLIFAAGSVALAGIIEIERKHYGRVKQNVFNTTINASTMSVFYQVPQYILQGVSEALVSVTGLEFAYSQSPPELRGMVMGMCLAMIGFGYYIASLLASIVKHASHSKWYPDDLNKGKLEYYMFLLAGLMLVNLAVFVYLALKYHYVAYHQDNPEDYEHCERQRSCNSVNSSSFSDISQNDPDKS